MMGQKSGVLLEMSPNVMIQTPHKFISLKNVLDASRPLLRFSQIRKGFFEIHNERSRGKAAVLQMKFVLRSVAQEPMAAKIYKIVG